MTWNTDISAAPRGYEKKVSHIDNKGRTITKTVFVPQNVILACGDGETVTVSRWLPNVARWNMLATGEQPVAWMPWPNHPSEASQ